MHNMHKKEDKRPWGNFIQFTHNEPCSVKILTINKGQSISLQYHHKRDEFWRVLSGDPIITVGDKTTHAKAGDEFFILQGAKHRLAGGNTDAQVLEISFGDFDENDIVRLEDTYGRD